MLSGLVSALVERHAGVRRHQVEAAGPIAFGDRDVDEIVGRHIVRGIEAEDLAVVVGAAEIELFGDRHGARQAVLVAHVRPEVLIDRVERFAQAIIEVARADGHAQLRRHPQADLAEDGPLVDRGRIAGEEIFAIVVERHSDEVFEIGLTRERNRHAFLQCFRCLLVVPIQACQPIPALRVFRHQAQLLRERLATALALRAHCQLRQHLWRQEAGEDLVADEKRVVVEVACALANVRAAGSQLAPAEVVRHRKIRRARHGDSLRLPARMCRRAGRRASRRPWNPRRTRRAGSSA